MYRLTYKASARSQKMESPCFAWLSMPVPTQHQKESNGWTLRSLPVMSGTM